MKACIYTLLLCVTLLQPNVSDGGPVKSLTRPPTLATRIQRALQGSVNLAVPKPAPTRTEVVTSKLKHLFRKEPSEACKLCTPVVHQGIAGKRIRVDLSGESSRSPIQPLNKEEPLDDTRLAFAKEGSQAELRVATDLVNGATWGTRGILAIAPFSLYRAISERKDPLSAVSAIQVDAQKLAGETSLTANAKYDLRQQQAAFRLRASHASGNEGTVEMDTHGWLTRAQLAAPFALFGRRLRLSFTELPTSGVTEFRGEGEIGKGVSASAGVTYQGDEGLVTGVATEGERRAKALAARKFSRSWLPFASTLARARGGVPAFSSENFTGDLKLVFELENGKDSIAPHFHAKRWPTLEWRRRLNAGLLRSIVAKEGLEVDWTEAATSSGQWHTRVSVPFSAPEKASFSVRRALTLD